MLSLNIPKLLKELGSRYIGKIKKQKVKYGLFECPSCSEHFEAIIANVTRGNTTKCSACKYKDSIGNSFGTGNLAEYVSRKKQDAANTFITKAIEVHGKLYDYSLVVYTGSTNKVSIICKVHGEFLQAPNKHKAGRGCPICANDNRSIKLRATSLKPAILYYVEFPQLGMYKIGVTTTSIDKRFENSKGNFNVLMVKTYEYAKDAYIDEGRVLKELADFRYNVREFGKVLKDHGDSELLIEDKLDEVIRILTA